MFEIMSIFLAIAFFTELEPKKDAIICVETPQTVEISERNGNTRPLYLTSEKPICRSRSNRSQMVLIGPQINENFDVEVPENN